MSARAGTLYRYRRVPAWRIQLPACGRDVAAGSGLFSATCQLSERHPFRRHRPCCRCLARTALHRRRGGRVWISRLPAHGVAVRPAPLVALLFRRDDRHLIHVFQRLSGCRRQWRGECGLSTDEHCRDGYQCQLTDLHGLRSDTGENALAAIRFRPYVTGRTLN